MVTTVARGYDHNYEVGEVVEVWSWGPALPWIPSRVVRITTSGHVVVELRDRGGQRHDLSRQPQHIRPLPAQVVWHYADTEEVS